MDSGAQVSVTPSTLSSTPTSFLSAANGSRIPAWGAVSLPVVLAGKKFGSHSFVRAAVDRPILGADFFESTGLAIDVKRRRLFSAAGRPFSVSLHVSGASPPRSLGLLCPATLDECGQDFGLPTSPTSQQGVSAAPPLSAKPLAAHCETQTLASKHCKLSSHWGVSQAPPLSCEFPLAASTTQPRAAATGTNIFPPLLSPPLVASVTIPPEFATLLAGFPSVANRDSMSFAANPAHGVEHVIVTTGQPISAKFRRLDPAKLAAAKAEFQAMESAGIIRPSDSPWASPLHLVPKPDGTWRPTGDYRRLNNATVPDRYPLPNIQDFTANLKGRKFFSKMDLVKGYYQVPMAAGDIGKTAVITPFGLFEWLVMPFGVRNAANTFQRMMDRCLRGLPFAFVFLDDIMVASYTREQHLLDVKAVLERLLEFGLVINPQKSTFCTTSVEFLGHSLTADTISPLQKHVDSISSFQTPSTKKELQWFLGLINFYRRFLPNIAAVLRPLTDALRGGPRQPLIWSQECSEAFSLAKSRLSTRTKLFHPDQTAPISLAVDASGSHVGAVFQQLCSGSWQPLSFFSRKLSPQQAKYSAFDRELLAAFAAVRHWRHLLEGRSFTIFTDHRPLTTALFRVSQPWSARQQRQLSYLSEFQVKFSHISGVDNVAADALSRPPLASNMPELCAVSSVPLCAAVDYEELARLQMTCPDVKLLLEKGSLRVKSFKLPIPLLCDVSTSLPRPLVPTASRRQVFLSLHGLAHPGVRASTRLISSRFVWRGLSRDVRLWCKQCDACQRGKVTRHAAAPIRVIPVPDLPFTSVNLDVVGPFPVCAGFRYLLTMVDRTTRWPEAAPLPDVSTATLASAFLHTWVSRFGVPASLTSDRGAQFTSSVWSELCSLLGTKHHLTTSYRPQANGMVERFHRRLKDALRARLVGVDWLHHLPWVLLGLRTAPREESGTSAAQHALGTPLHLPGQFVHDDGFGSVVHRHLSGLPPLPPRHNRSVKPALLRPLDSAPFVYIRVDTLAKPPLSPLYTGPFRVVARHESHFEVMIGSTIEKININRLKPAFLPDDTVPALPPRRGRPPRKPPSNSGPTSKPRRGRPRKCAV